jgi:hypothetical protein
VVGGAGGWCLGFTVVVVVGGGSGNRTMGGVVVGVDPDLVVVGVVATTGTNGKVTVNGEVKMVGVVEAFLAFLVGFVLDVTVVSDCAVVGVVVGGGGSCTGACGTLVVVVLTGEWSPLFTESPTRACPTARGD